MGKYDFDEIIDRRGTNSSKWDGFEERFNGLDVTGAIPMWVADMDFRAPKEVVQMLTEKAAFGIYGYPSPKGKGFDGAIRKWLARRLDWEIQDEWIIATAGVVPAVTYAVQAFTEPGDGVLIQTPVYYPFKDRCIKFNERQAVENPLLLENGRYEIDFADFEEKASRPETKLFVLCSPHNPVGRVWTVDELAKMFAICEKYQVIVFSDEIHSDLILDGYKHHASGKIKQNNLIAAYAPSKTFNLAGLKTSAIIIPDSKLRQAYRRQMDKDEANGMNLFGLAAFETAYNECEDYLEALLVYINQNMAYVRQFTKQRLAGVTAIKTEGTYLAWLDFRETGLSTAAIYQKVCEEAKVAPDLGGWFGTDGEGFIRLNLACPKATIEEAMRRLEKIFGIEKAV